MPNSVSFGGVKPIPFGKSKVPGTYERALVSANVFSNAFKAKQPVPGAGNKLDLKI